MDGKCKRNLWGRTAMRKDNHLLTAIMELVEICGGYETVDPLQIYHVELLDEMGLVKSEVAPGAKSAKVKRLTAKGHATLDNLHAYVLSLTAGGELSEEDRKAMDKAYAMEVSETRRYEKILYLLASGGICIALKVIEWCIGRPVRFEGTVVTLTLASLSWVVTLGTLMPSHASSMLAHEEFVRQIGLGNQQNGWDSSARRWTKIFNGISGSAFIVGATLMIVAMFIVVCTYPCER